MRPCCPAAAGDERPQRRSHVCGRPQEAGYAPYRSWPRGLGLAHERRRCRRRSWLCHLGCRRPAGQSATTPACLGRLFTPAPLLHLPGAVGGHVLAHASTFRLSVRKGKAEQRLMKVCPDCVAVWRCGGSAAARLLGLPAACRAALLPLGAGRLPCSTCFAQPARCCPAAAAGGGRAQPAGGGGLVRDWRRRHRRLQGAWGAERLLGSAGWLGLGVPAAVAQAVGWAGGSGTNSANAIASCLPCCRIRPVQLFLWPGNSSCGWTA